MADHDRGATLCEAGLNLLIDRIVGRVDPETDAYDDQDKDNEASDERGEVLDELSHGSHSPIASPMRTPSTAAQPYTVETFMTPPTFQIERLADASVREISSGVNPVASAAWMISSSASVPSMFLVAIS